MIESDPPLYQVTLSFPGQPLRTVFSRKRLEVLEIFTEPLLIDTYLELPTLSSQWMFGRAAPKKQYRPNATVEELGFGIPYYQHNPSQFILTSSPQLMRFSHFIPYHTKLDSWRMMIARCSRETYDMCQMLVSRRHLIR